MSASPPTSSPTKWVECPDCGQRLGFRAEDTGRKGKCQKCGRVFRIGDRVELPDAAPPPSPKSTAELPETVTFGCELCQTRMTARTADAGRPVKCPDCGRRNVIPLPQAISPVPTPQAMSGAQYELWDVDVAPKSAEITARSPKLHPTHCELCGTLMYAKDAQLGTKLKCADCGHLTTAKPRVPEKPTGPVPVLAGDEYELDEASAPTPRPAPVPVAIRDAEEHEQFRAAADADRRKHREELPAYERPEMPAIPLVRGVLPMLVTGELLKRLVMLSLWLSVIAWFGMQVALASAGGMGAIAAVCFLAIACILGMLWMTSAAPLWLAMVTESSEGHDGLQDPPRWSSFEWFGETLFFVIPAAACCVPAWLAAKGAEQAGVDPDWLPAAAGGVWLVCFPVVLLSALNEGSPLDIFSTRILASLGRCFGPWFLFYAASAIWLAAFGLAIWKVPKDSPAALWILPWLGVAATLVYARLIGRLAWWLSESMPPVEELEAK